MDSDGIDFPGYAADGQAERAAIHAFDAARGEWIESEGAASTWDGTSLDVATWNTWFQGPDADARHAGLLACLERVKPDVLMLQEVTVPLLAKLCAAPWLREGWRFVRTAFREDTIPAHGLVLFTRLPLAEARIVRLKTYMGRRLLLARCRTSGGDLELATVHLESMKNYGDVRAQQLATLFAELEPSRDALVGGDFNFCSSDAVENARLDARFADLWPALRHDEPGYTQDTAANPMLARAKKAEKRVRIDRLLLRSDGPARWKARSIELLGTAPAGGRGDLYPSDHFGLLARLASTRA